MYESQRFSEFTNGITMNMSTLAPIVIMMIRIIIIIITHRHLRTNDQHHVALNPIVFC